MPNLDRALIVHTPTGTIYSIDANLGVRTQSPGSQLHVVGSGFIASGLSVSGLITANSGNFTNNLQLNGTGVSISGHTHTASQVGAISGVGASGYLARWTSNSGIGSGLMYDNGSGIGIGTTTPSSRLQVSGLITSNSGLFLNDLAMSGRYSERFVSVAIASSGLTLNLTSGNLFTCSLNSNITTLTVTGVPTVPSTAIGFGLIFTADGTARTVTWPSGFKWAGSTAPTLSSGNTKQDFLSFITINSGTNWFGFVGGQNY
jgi:hypothetical protein